MKKLRFMKALLLMYLLMVGIGNAWGEEVVAFNWSTMGSTNVITSGYTTSATGASPKTGYYQDNSGIVTLMGYNKSTSMFSATPEKVLVVVTLGGGSSDKDLESDVFAQFVDKDGKEVGTAISVTNHITNSGGDTYTKEMNLTGVSTANGVKIYHAKESGYNVRYINLSVKYLVSSTPAYPYTVTFNAGANGTCLTSSLTESSAGAGVTLPNVTANDGYNFKGWSTSSTPSSADAGATGATYKPSSDCTLYAYYKKLHTARFFVNGVQSGETQTLEDGEAITFPANPADIDDYKFVGWITSTIDGTTNVAPDFVTSATMGTSNVTYYAVFAKLISGGDEEWQIITDASNITNGVYAIISFDTDYFLPNETASGNCPKVASTSKEDGKITTERNIKWNLSISADGAINLESQSYPCNYLWGGSANDGTRVNTTSTKNGATKDWYVKNTSDYGLVLYNKATANDRYLATYGTTDWRNYESISTFNRAANLYKLIDGIVYSDYCTTITDQTATYRYSLDIVGPGEVVFKDEDGNTINAGDPIKDGTNIYPTFTPGEGYKFSKWEFFASNGNWYEPQTEYFTITKDVQFRVTFEPLHTFTIKWNVNDTEVSTTTAYEGEEISFSTPDSGFGGYVFRGWTNERIVGINQDAPDLLYTPGSTTHVTSDVTFYAVFATEHGEPDYWEKVVDRATMETGVYAMISSDGHAFNGTFTDGNSSHGQQTENVFEFNSEGKASFAPSGACELTVTKIGENTSSNKYTIYSEVHDKYLCITAATAGNLKFKDGPETNYWDFSKNSNQEVGAEQFIYHYSNTSQLRYYNNTFRNYQTNVTTNGEVVMFAKKVEGNATYSDFWTTIPFDEVYTNFAVRGDFPDKTTNDWELRSLNGIGVNKFSGVIDATLWADGVEFGFQFYNKEGDAENYWDNGSKYDFKTSNSYGFELAGHTGDMIWKHNGNYKSYYVIAEYKYNGTTSQYNWDISIKGIPAGMYLPGSWNNWDPSDENVMFANNTITLTLEENTEYEFKIFQPEADIKWYGCTGMIEQDTESPWVFHNSDITNCKLKTLCAGEYVFTLSYKDWEPCVSVEYPKEVLPVGSSNYATYYNSKFAYKMPADCEGYVAYYDDNDNWVFTPKYSGGDVVPADEALVIKANESGSKALVYAVTDNTTYASQYMNDLRGTDEKVQIPNDDNYYYYGFSYGHSGTGNADKLGFYWRAENGAAFENGAHKAYLMVLKNRFESNPAKAGGFSIEDLTNGISNVNINTNEVLYNLNGQRVNTPKRGQIYIMNGRKFIAK